MRFYLGVAIACGCVMALQILQSRIFSVVTWYHLSFLTISIAMFGLTLGALKVYRESKTQTQLDLPARLQRASLMFGIFAFVALLVQLSVPIIHNNIKAVLITLPVVAFITTIGYFYAGQMVSLCLTRSGRPVGKVYAADMIGASLGCLLALALMQSIDSPSAIILVSALILANSLLFSNSATKQRNLTVFLALCLTGLSLFNAQMKNPMLYPLWSKSSYIGRDQIMFEDWNAISRVIVVPSEMRNSHRDVFLWGPSPITPIVERTDYKVLMVDGAAITPVTKFDGKNWNDLSYLEYDITNIAHFMPGIESWAIVGAGGGRDILSALYFGVDHVTALDINDIQISLLMTNPEFRAYSNLWQHPGLKLIHAEARNWFTHSTEKFDAIQISLIDTWVSAGAGAYALTENALYTVDAWKTFLSDLKDNGILTVSRWHFKGSYNDLGRLVSMTSAALLEMGIEDPWKNVFIVHTGRIATLVIGRNALTDAQLDGLHKAADKFQYEILASPRMKDPTDIVNKLLHVDSKAAINDVIKDLPFDMTPPTDQRPFFFNQARMNRPLEVIQQATSSSMLYQNLMGHAVATVNLYIIILFSVLASLLVLVLPYRKALVNAPSAFIKAGSLYFTLIGLGFMFVEIPMMQIMSMFLGHPVYGLGVILFSLILSTGIGSYVSESFVLNTRSRLTVWALVTFAFVVILSLSIHPLLNNFIAASLPVRIMVCLALIFPCGLLMGFAFPTGMRLTEKVSDRLTPWFWSINGAAGVMASALAMATSIMWGLNVTLLIGAACYALLALPATRLMSAR